MTLLVDRRKDNYDDLLMLARDARVSRGRVNRWTFGLVVGAMTAMGVYVATVNQEVEQLRDNAKDAVEQRDTIRGEYARLMAERNALKAQMDIFARYEDMYADIAPALILGDRFKDISITAPGGTRRTPVTPAQAPQFSLSNLVWIVDGSRRFPMTSGDILWIPEGKFWIRMEPGPGRKPNKVTIHKGDRPVESAAGEEDHTFAASPNHEDNAYRIPVGDLAAARRGVADCIKLTYHEQSSRAGFEGTNFVDIEVLFYNDSTCPRPNPDAN